MARTQPAPARGGQAIGHVLDVSRAAVRTEAGRRDVRGLRGVSRETVMQIDPSTPCPACHYAARDLFVAARRVVSLVSTYAAEQGLLELADAVEAFRPFYEAHHANQDHATSTELTAARETRFEVSG